MKLAAATLLFASITLLAQGPTAADHPFRQEVLKNDRVTVYSVDIPPGQTTPQHRHDHDVVAVYLNGGTTEWTTEKGTKAQNRLTAGDVRFRPAPFAHAVKNTGNDDFRVVDVEFAEPAGGQEKPPSKKTHYCNPGSKDACVTEDYLFCTAKFCVEDVTMGPWAKSSKHTHDTDHILVGLTDYNLADDIAGREIINRRVKSGGVEYIPAGITHVLTNTSNDTVRFIAILFRQ